VCVCVRERERDVGGAARKLRMKKKSTNERK